MPAFDFNLHTVAMTLATKNNPLGSIMSVSQEYRAMAQYRSTNTKVEGNKALELSSKAGRESGREVFVCEHGGTGKKALLCRFCRPSPPCDGTAVRQWSRATIVLHYIQRMQKSGLQSNTFVKSIHIRLTFRSRATVSTISREIAIVIASPSPSL
jgi:hypothetical protein